MMLFSQIRNPSFHGLVGRKVEALFLPPLPHEINQCVPTPLQRADVLKVAILGFTPRRIRVGVKYHRDQVAAGDDGVVEVESLQGFSASTREVLALQLFKGQSLIAPFDPLLAFVDLSLECLSEFFVVLTVEVAGNCLYITRSAIPVDCL